MSWLSALKSRWHRPAAPEIVLLPCDSVLFPGGQLDLTLPDPRWREKLANRPPLGLCLRNNEGWQRTGTLAEIISQEEAPEGLRLRLQGGDRFRLLGPLPDDSKGSSDLEILPPRTQTLPAEFRPLLPLLEQALLERGLTPDPDTLDDAEWVSFRWCEILPIHARARFKLLELNDPQVRLQLIARFLQERGLLTGAI